MVIPVSCSDTEQALRPSVVRRLMKELMHLKNEPPEGIRVTSPDDNMLDVTGIIEGPGEQRHSKS